MPSEIHGIDPANTAIEEPVIDCYIVVDAQLAGNLRARYLQSDEDQAKAETYAFLQPLTPPFTLLGLPSRASLLDSGIDATIRDAVDELVVQIQILARYVPSFRLLPTQNSAEGTSNVFKGFGIEAAVAGGGYWLPMPEGGRGFGTRAEAEVLIGAASLRKHGLTGEGVNVVLFDSGLDPVERQQLEIHTHMQHKGDEYRVYEREAPPAPRYDHGWYTARHVKALAPNAIIHDYAILPPRLSHALIPSIMANVHGLISDIIVGYQLLRAQIALARTHPKGPRVSEAPWVVINAWALYRRPPTLRDDITDEELGLPPNQRIRAIIDENPERMDLDDGHHYLNTLIETMAQTLNVDFVFAAGNCGFASPDPRCGINDRGPGRSIIGPAGHPDVMTVAACRDDMTWIGSSSQGPSIMNNVTGHNQKPDFAAPSCFFEDSDAARLFSGTSTACAITGAAMAALRQANRTWPPYKLRDALIQTARQVPSGPQQDTRFGAGILDLKAALRVIL